MVVRSSGGSSIHGSSIYGSSSSSEGKGSSH